MPRIVMGGHLRDTAAALAGQARGQAEAHRFATEVGFRNADLAMRARDQQRADREMSLRQQQITAQQDMAERRFQEDSRRFDMTRGDNMNQRMMDNIFREQSFRRGVFESDRSFDRGVLSGDREFGLRRDDFAFRRGDADRRFRHSVWADERRHRFDQEKFKYGKGRDEVLDARAAAEAALRARRDNRTAAHMAKQIQLQETGLNDRRNQWQSEFDASQRRHEDLVSSRQAAAAAEAAAAAAKSQQFNPDQGIKVAAQLMSMLKSGRDYNGRQLTDQEIEHLSKQYWYINSQLMGAVGGAGHRDPLTGAPIINPGGYRGGLEMIDQ